jgi:hypothetical protein
MSAIELHYAPRLAGSETLVTNGPATCGRDMHSGRRYTTELENFRSGQFGKLCPDCDRLAPRATTPTP